jgi:hypothetical protein
MSSDVVLRRSHFVCCGLRTFGAVDDDVCLPELLFAVDAEEELERLGVVVLEVLVVSWRGARCED